MICCRCRLVLIAWSVADLLCSLMLSRHADARACAGVTIAVDTSRADGSLGAIMGTAIGQTFMAPETLISSITVWRHPLDTPNSSPMKLWITGVDSSGKPIIGRVILDGPILVVRLGDGVHPIRIRYDFDPPVPLPSRGQYAFFIHHQCAGLFELIDVSHDEYSGGNLWLTGRSQVGGCYLRSDHPGNGAPSDLIFEIEFCERTTTPVRSTRWGRLKVIYR